MKLQNKNSNNQDHSQDKHLRKPWKIVIILGVVLVVSMVVLFLVNRYSSRDGNIVDTTSKTTSTAPSAQEDFTGATERPVLEKSPNNGEANVSDNQGSIPTTTDKTKWSKSQTGQITVYSPSSSQLLQNGDIISGESVLQTVSFRIIDSISGVISQGQLSVVNGKFSGSVSYKTAAPEGRLDIFSMSADGTEFSNIEIPVRFK